MLALPGGICYTLHSEIEVFTFQEVKMKLSKVDIDKRIESLTTKLLGDPGLKYARKIVAGVKKNLAAEYKRRKNL